MLGKLARDIAGRLSGRTPPDAPALNSRGLELQREGDLGGAMRAFEAAIAADAARPQPHVNLANVLQDLGELERAIRHYDAALKLEPDLASAHYSRATALLSLERYAEGWAEYEWRRRLPQAPAAPRFAQPRWTGEDISGKRVLLYAEQGYGDAVQFVRYAARVAARGAQVIVACQRGLAALLRTAEGVHEVVADGDALPGFDYHAALMSLPSVLGTTPETIPSHVPYLSAPAAAVDAWASRVAGVEARKVGIAWAGNPGHANDRNRSLPVDALPQLLDAPGCAWFSLQKAATLKADAPQTLPVVDYSAEWRDFADTAAFIAALDVVVTVDTAVAHVAGALGKPVFLLLPFAADWRWTDRGETTRWYPTMRLFRQARRGDWRAPIDGVKRALAELA